MHDLISYIQSYLGSDRDARRAAETCSGPRFIFFSFLRGLSVAVIAMNWLERKILAHMQVRLGPMRVGPHGLLQPIADAIKLLLKEDIIPAEADEFVFWVAPFIVVLAAFTVFVVVPFGPDARHHRHEHRHPVYARGFVAQRAGHCHRGMGLELALSADRRAAVERADGFVRSRDGTGRRVGHPDDEHERRGHRHAQHDRDRAGATGAAGQWFIFKFFPLGSSRS